MIKQSLALAAFAVVTMYGTAHAADIIVTSLSTGTDDGQPTTSVSFDYKDCEEECHVASLTCTGTGGVDLERADVPTRDVVKAMQRNERQVEIKAGKQAFDFHIQSMSFAELTGAWWVTAPHFATEANGLQKTLQTAATMTVRITTDSVTLPVDANVKAWAKGCM